jgi:hypothetical protein
MKFVLPQSLLRDISFHKVFRESKNKIGQVILPKTGLVTLGTYGHLGVKCRTT